MVANRRRDTRPEKRLRQELHRRGLRFLVDVAPEGVTKRRRVDVLLRGSRVAVLVHGCFWHCCPEHFHLPKSNSAWWTTKFEAIQLRDADTVAKLERAGWLPVVVWEHEDPSEAADRVLALDRERRPPRPP